MPLAPGTKLGPYEIQSPLGAGGMGEVYRARDTRLERTVAIKILPAHFSSDPVRKQRFEREAKTISSLNHPHICVLHDVGHQDGIDYLVMECVEGETLAKRLEKGPLPLEQVLKYGMQTADALDKAHRSGVVHRDLKPGNIMLTPTGAKLLDFGLAKPAVAVASMATLTAAATQTTPMTQEGTIVGTFQYMSPEQVEGKELDGRSDIFSLGAVLYEMLTGQRAFPGKSQLSVASAILEKEPAPISSVKPLTPPALDHAIRRCLTKEPERRWQNAGDLARELEWVAESGSQAGVSAPISARSRTRERLAWTSTLIAASIATVFAFVYLNKPASQLQVLRSTILPPEGGAFIFNGPNGGAFLSPDGSSVAFIARVGKVTQLWVRPLDSFAARALPGTEDSSFAFWSPDSRNLGFFAQGKVKRIAVAGGPPQAVCDADSNRGASWGRSDVIIFARISGEILHVPASGGTPQRVTTLDAIRHEGTHRWPYFLPDGNHFLFMAALLGPVSEDNVFYLGSLDGKGSRILFHGSSPIAYSMGHVLYLADNVLVARPFDPVKLAFTGEPVPIAEGVQFDSLFSNGTFSVSENGALLYQQGKGSSAHSIVLFDRTGKQLGSLGESAPNSAPRLSPDGKNLVYDLISTSSGKVELWMLNIGSGSRTRLSSDPLNLVSHSPVWSPEGRHVAYSSAKTGNRAIYIRAIDQIKQEEERWEAKDDTFFGAGDWTPDGKFLVLTERPIRTGEQRISLLSVSGKDGAVPLIEVPGANVDSGQVSPDGRWIAYRSDESGKTEIYITSFPKPVGKLQVSIAGGVTPRWRHDGKELYYLAPDRKLMAVELKETGGSLQVAATRPLFEMFQTMFLTAAGVSQYDVTRDGSQFVVDSAITDETPAPLNLVVNWNAELKKK
jgi:serine/threonine protein kinase/Tol biopolymer transport system component